jgi:hypothetical protein
MHILHEIISTDGINLRFHNDEEYEEFKKKELELYMTFYDTEVKKYGYFDTNKRKYFKNSKKLRDNPLASTHMMELYEKYTKEDKLEFSNGHVIEINKSDNKEMWKGLNND